MTGVSDVSFAGVPAPSFSVISDEQIEVTVPELAAGMVDVVVAASGNGATSAPARLPCRELVWSDDFDGTTIDPAKWGLYEGPGNAGNGIRSPAQIAVADSAVTISCDTAGTTGGMWGNWTQQYGVWEARVRATPASDSIHPVLLLWPHDDRWPEHGEVDYCECETGDRQSVAGYLHYGDGGDQTTGEIDVDLTEWQVFTVIWTPHSMSYYCNGRRWFRDANKAHLPPVGMNPTIQLDWTGDRISQAGAMLVDWVRIYSDRQLEEPPQIIGASAPDTLLGKLARGLRGR